MLLGARRSGCRLDIRSHMTRPTAEGVLDKPSRPVTQQNGSCAPATELDQIRSTVLDCEENHTVFFQ